MKRSLIWEFGLYGFKLGYNTVEATKDIYWVKSESAIDYNTVT